jgi:uncharacterized repeat protein (TIGR03843 family)
VERSSFQRTRDKNVDPSASSRDQAIALLQEGTIKTCQLIYSGSNAVFLVSLYVGGTEGRAVYKPRSGENPLWDFPDGTLYRRERAAYLVSEALGWSLVPATIIRNGPHGVGAVQRFVAATPVSDYSSLFEAHAEEFRRIALFDWLTNNADRKVGHCLLDHDGRIWGIDHGLTFHTDPKLRTVIWEFGGQRVPSLLERDLVALAGKLAAGRPLWRSLLQLLAEDEVAALGRRLRGILARPVFPLWSGSYHSVPWPPF